MNHTQTIRRAATLLCAALSGLALGPVAQAQTGPLPASPNGPTAYQSPLFHSGGVNDPNTGAYIVPSLADLLNGQLQGTPTGLDPLAATKVPTQIPSYLLGDYDPNRPPGLAGTYYPNHFADGDVYSWQAPFNYVAQATGFQQVDDSQNGTAFNPPGPGATNGFTATSTWAQITTTQSPAAGTAVNAEYLRLAPGVNGTATWQLVLPVPAAGLNLSGVYSVYFNIPNDLPDVSNVAETRSTSVLYFITVRDPSGAITATSTATVSQTEANANQFLGGPFQLAAGSTVTVTLTRNIGRRINSGNYNLVADQIVLQRAVGDVQSTPTAINYESYPTDFARAKYWGIYVPDAGDLAPTVGASAAANAVPDTINGTLNGTPLFHVGDPTQAKLASGAADPTGRRRIRQLVYFGRSEPLSSRSVTVDDAAAGFSNPGGGGQVSSVTATNGEYRRFGATTGVFSTGAPPPAVGVWTLTTPTTVVGNGSYFVNVHIPQTPLVGTPSDPGYPESRLGRVTYTVTVNGVTTKPVTISQVTGGADAVVTLPTGALHPAPGSTVLVNLYNITGTTTAPAANSFVVADSVSLTTGNGQGAIYCVDGFTGGVVWRYETPGSANGASAPVFSSPAVARINVLVPQLPSVTTAPKYQNKLVVIVGDNSGLVYCLDAIGNGDGTSNSAVLDPATQQPITVPQTVYGTPAPAFNPATPHVGTTPVYWIYRPDASKPKIVTGTGIGTVKPTTDPNTDLPVPASFGSASPTVFVDPNVTTTPDASGLLPSNATVYVGNTNGVLYALDATGVSDFGKTSYAAVGDTFNVPQDLRADTTVTTLPAADLDPIVPSCQPRWWFTLRGPDPNGATNTSSADIESAPALYLKSTPGATAGTFTLEPTVYIGSAHEVETTSNVGRLYALDGRYGPAGNSGRTDPSPLTGQPDPLLPGYTGPGSFNYNVGQRPKINAADTAHWSFPDAYGTGKSSDGKARAALGNVTGSPVVFTNVRETGTNADGTPRKTRIYFAANSGYEATATVTKPASRPDAALTGRIWAVNLDGSVGTTTNQANGPVWAYPLAKDPNLARNDPTSASYVKIAEPNVPIGAFLHATPAMGFVQFPAVIDVSGGYNPTDVFGPLKGRPVGSAVPMLYVGTRGTFDTALYAIDIDGTIVGANDSRLIYRQLSPNGTILQSSPVLITNATAANSGGNGGSVFFTAGNSFYDYSATPISNPGIIDPATGIAQTFPLIRQNKLYTGFGPFSSPTVAATSVADLGVVTDANGPLYGGRNVTDWVYVGDSTTGFCRGITPRDQTYSGIPGGAFDYLIPPSVDAPVPGVQDSFIQAYLMPEPSKDKAASTTAYPIGPKEALPVYEWGQNVYIRFGNVVPPNQPTPANPQGDPALFVYDHAKLSTAAPSNPVPVYTNGQAITFSLADADPSLPNAGTDSRQVPTVTNITLPANGFIIDPAPKTFSPASSNLADNNNAHWAGAFTYTIADGSASQNTPGARRTLLDIKQSVTRLEFTNAANDGSLSNPANFRGTTTTTILTGSTSNGNLVSTPILSADGKTTTGYAPTKVEAVDQPTFGILNPLGVRGGGVSLLAPAAGAFRVGDDLGPFRGIANGTIPAGTSAPNPVLEALTNGNDIPQKSPPSTTGGGSIDPTKPLAADDRYAPPVPIPFVVVTATGMIPHNNNGNNADPSYDPTVNGGRFPVGSSANVGNGLGNPDQFFGPYALNLFDRGALFPGLGQTLRVKLGIPTTSTGTAFAPPQDRDGLYWNDNSQQTTVPNHDAVVNWLPWETPPTGYQTGTANPSLDYPDIAPGNLAATLYYTPTGAPDPNQFPNGGSADLGGTVDLSHSNGQPGSQSVQANAVQIRVSVPRFQPANQQLYQRTPGAPIGLSAYDAGGQIPSVDVQTGATRITGADLVFPMGYVTTKRIYVPDRNGNPGNGRPFRDVRVYTGVPPDFTTQMDNPTVEVGKVPSSYGVQTGSFVPPAVVPAQALGEFTPYNPAFQGSDLSSGFKPLNAIHNIGNANLLNAHLDQQRQIVGGNPYPMLLTSDALDFTSVIPGYDFGGITGPAGSFQGPTSLLPAELFLVRSSLDTDLAAAWGRNPSIANSPLYPGATFHKARVGSGQPSTLSVPDAPESFVPGASLDDAPNNLPTHKLDGNNLPFKTAPFVSVAIPFGTPVGNYNGSLQLFEGLDHQVPYSASGTVLPGGPGSYTGLVAQLYPPLYGGSVGGIKPPTSALQNADQLVQTPTGLVSLMPISKNGTVLSVKVVEDRMTDGSTFGAVPQVDLGGAGTGANSAAVSTPDFGPAAFLDPTSHALSLYWTSGRTALPPPTAAPPYGIVAANVPYAPATGASPNGYYTPGDPTRHWWNPVAGLTGPGVNSGLTIAQDALDPAPASVFAFAVNVQTQPYRNTLFFYPVTPKTGALGGGTPVTNDPGQVKYGVKGLIAGSAANFTRSRWAFWTAQTRGRTAIYYNSQDPNGGWIPASPAPSTTALLPIPAGLTAVSDPAPLLLFGNVTVPGSATPTLQATVDVTYSGTGPDGNVDLYESRYQPAEARLLPPGVTAADPSKLVLVPFQPVTEILKATGQAGGWYQARDVAWSRTSQLNLSVGGVRILYDNAGTQLFRQAVFDRASGLLVITGLGNPALNTTPVQNAFATAPANAVITAYLDLATGRVRFNYPPSATVTAFFSPLARRITDDSRADTGVNTFLDGGYKANDAAGVAPVLADRRWFVWRKAGVGATPASATIYYKTQRLTAFLPFAVDTTKTFTFSINGAAVTPDIHNIPAVKNTDGSIKYRASARLYFSIQSGAEGGTLTGSYTATDGTVVPSGPLGVVQWQDEVRANDAAQPFLDTAATTATTQALAATVPGYAVPLDQTINENNVSAFLDPAVNDQTLNSPAEITAGRGAAHKVWLFWNSTRNGTADVYYETINPRFAAGP